MAETHQSNQAATDQDQPSTEPRARFSNRTILSLMALLMLSVVAIIFGQDLIRTLVGESSAKKRAFGELRISYYRPRILYELDPPETERDFERYKKTQGKLLTSSFVLKAALSQNGIRNNKLLKQQSDPTGWLEDHLEVEFPGDEFIRLSLNAPLSQEAVEIVNAVLTAYLNEVVYRDETVRLDRLRTLDSFHSDIEEDLLSKKRALASLMEVLEQTDPQTLTPTQEVEAEYIDQIQKRIVQIKLELVQVVSRLSAVQEVEFPSKDEIELAVNTDPVIVRLTADYLVQEELIAQTSDRANDEGDQNEPQQLANDRRRLQAVERALGKRRSLLEKSIREQLVDAPQRRLQANVARLKSEQEKFEQELDKLKITVRVTRTFSFELESLKQEIALTAETALRFATEIEQLQIEVQAPQRVKLQRMARFP